MKYSRLSALLFCFFSFTALLFAQSSVSTQVNNAVLGVYDDELRQNPSNYNVLFRRAYLFYGQNQYNRALADIDRAIPLVPAKDTDMLVQCYSLRANIYLMTDNPSAALSDLTEASRLDPSSYTLLYQKANTEFLLGNYAVAKDDYRRLGRLQNRSLESLIGQARIAVKENNLGLANEFVDQAVALYPTSSEAFTRRASVRQLLGNNVGAADDLIMAIAVDKDGNKAIRDLVALSHVDYSAVISALTSAISQAPDTGIYIYLRASIAQAHYHYLPAISDYLTLIDGKVFATPGIYASIAECQLALCDYTSALQNINYAIGSSSDNAPFYVIRARIHRALGNFSVAMESASTALEKNPRLNSALIEKGYCAIALNQFGDASDFLGEAALNDPDNPLLPLIRGWLLKNRMHREIEGDNFLRMSAELTSYPQSINSFRGFALQALGDNSETLSWIEQALESATDVDGHAHFLAACLYSHLDNPDLALDMLKISLQKGFSSLYDITTANIANLNLTPLRTNPALQSLLQSFDYLFN